MTLEVSIGILVLLGVLTEALTERFFGTWLAGKRLVWISTAMAMAFCLILKINGLELLPIGEPLGHPYTGQIITGLVIGGGSNFIHKIFGAVAPKLNP